MGRRRPGLSSFSGARRRPAADRLHPVAGQISRLCVLETRRNSGIGRALLVAAEEAARAAGMREIFLYAQTHATSFYEGAGFSASGGIFMDAHIPHRQMFKLLT